MSGVVVGPSVAHAFGATLPDITVFQFLAVVGLSLVAGAGLVWALLWVTRREATFAARRAERRAEIAGLLDLERAMIDKIESTSDDRVANNPPQQPTIPGDPMRLQYRLLSDVEKEKMGRIKRLHEDLWREIDALGASREVSIAKTALEESCMWAVKHITRPEGDGKTRSV